MTLTCSKGVGYFEAIVNEEHVLNETGICSPTGTVLLPKHEDFVIFKQPHRANFIYQVTPSIYRIRTFPKNLTSQLLFPLIDLADSSLDYTRLLQYIFVHGVFTKTTENDSNNLMYVVIREFFQKPQYETTLDLLRNSSIYAGEFEHGNWHRVIILNTDFMDNIVDLFYQGKWTHFPNTAKKQIIEKLPPIDKHYWSRVFYNSPVLRNELEGVLGTKLPIDAQLHSSPDKSDYLFDTELYRVDIDKSDLRLK